MRSILFVPADRPDRYLKALATGSDRVCIDLEDGVALRDKQGGRAAVVEFLCTTGIDLQRVIVRINDPSTELGRDDIAAIAHIRQFVGGISLPKVESPDIVNDVFDTCPHIDSVIALVETTRGLSNVFAIANHPQVSAIAFGSADYSTEIGCEMSWDALLYARSRIVHAAVQGNAIPLDGAWLDLNDIAGLEDDSRRLSGLGFRGRIALHPNQVEPILRAFSISKEAIEYARRIISVVESGRKGAFSLDGKMIDEPIIRRARMTLAST